MTFHPSIRYTLRRIFKILDGGYIMIRIITDTSTLYSKKEADAIGLEVIPLVVTINDKTYREYEEINPEEYMALIYEGHVPQSSQPAIGEMVEVLEKYMDDEVIVISVADGLSGTYSSWESAKDISNHPNTTIVNTKTLAFAQRNMAHEALLMRDSGASVEEILARLSVMSEFSKSYLLPTDIGFLKRGGRLTPLAASMSGLLKLQPVVAATDDGLKLEKFAVARNFNIGIKKIFEDIKAQGVDENYKFGVVHSQFIEKAEEIAEKIKETFGVDHVEIFGLSPAFITHGGPQCLAIQVVKK